MVVRLNEKLYDASVFEDKGIRHVEMVRIVAATFIISLALTHNFVCYILCFSHLSFLCLRTVPLTSTALSGRLESTGTSHPRFHQASGSNDLRWWKGSGALQGWTWADWSPVSTPAKLGMSFR